jgi:pimeloyl-ACP methyl ester carboxylesterase
VTKITFQGADGQMLAAEVHGPEHGAAVLFAHGGGQTRHAWHRTVATLAALGWRAIAIDLRGHGESEWSPVGNYRIDDFAADLLAVADQLGEPPALVGASLGGLAGLLAEGEQRPGSFASLTLVDIAPTMEPGGVAKVMGFMGAHLETGFASLDEAAETIEHYLPNRPRRSDSGGLARYLRRTDDGRYRWHWDPRFIVSVTTTSGEHRQTRLADAATRLRLPVHLIRGGASDLVTEEGAADFRRLVPHAAYTDIAGAGHMVVGDRNDAFSAAIVDFLESARTTRQHA